MNRPRVILKLATSLDGRIATAAGESRWITGEQARAEVHRMRAAVDAVMIGAGTARADDPSLLARTEPAPRRQPARVVVSSRFDIPKGKLFADVTISPLIVFGAEGADAGALQGAEIDYAPLADAGVDIEAVLARLAKRGIGRVLTEGGGTLAASLIAAGLVDRLEWFRAPIVLGAAGRPAVAALTLAHLSDAPRFGRVAVRELGPDLWESYERAL